MRDLCEQESFDCNLDSTCITVIPRKVGVEYIRHFKPINLVFIIQKFLGQTLCKRLKRVIDCCFLFGTFPCGWSPDSSKAFIANEGATLEERHLDLSVSRMLKKHMNTRISSFCCLCSINEVSWDIEEVDPS